MTIRNWRDSFSGILRFKPQKLQKAAPPRRWEMCARSARLLLPFLLMAGLLPLAAASSTPYQQALGQFQSGKFREASATLKDALRRGPESAGSEILLARCFYEMADWNAAILHANSAIRLNPSNAEAHRWLGKAYGRDAEKERSLLLAVKTRREFESAVALAPANVAARRDLMEFYLEAPWFLGGSDAKARRQAEAVGALDPVEGALARAQFDEQTGKASDAENEYREVLALKPQRLKPYLEAADFFVARKDVAGLEAALNGARRVNPSDPRLDYYRGVVHVLKGQRLTQAERDLKSYVADTPSRCNYPSHASALSWLGQLYEHWGKLNLAVIEYESALELDPNIFQARQALIRLKGE